MSRVQIPFSYGLKMPLKLGLCQNVSTTPYQWYNNFKQCMIVGVYPFAPLEKLQQRPCCHIDVQSN